jgi:O-antigen ligase
MHANAPVIERLSVAGLAMALALLAGVGAIGLFLGDLKILVLVAGTFMFAISLALTGNPRLYCLWGLVLTAPMDVDVSFMAIPHMGGAAAYTIDLVDFFIAPLVLFLLRDFALGYRRKLRLSGFTFFWGGLIVLGLGSVVIGPYRHVPMQEVVRMIKLLLLFIVFINEVVRVRQFKHVFAALMVGMAIQCFIGLTQYLFDINLGAQILGEAAQADVEYTSRATYLEDTFTYRIGALFGHPNLLSIYLVFMLSIGISMIFTSLNLILKVIVGALTLVGVSVLILTLSRSGWICFSIAFATLLGLSFVHPRSRRRFLMARAGLISLTTIVALVLSGPIVKRLLQSDSGALEFRFEWMVLAWRMIKAHPILGVGLNAFIFEMPPYSDYGSISALVDKFGPEQYLPVVHNIYLLVWSEQGTLGLLLFLGLNGYLFLIAWRNTKHFYNESLYMINIGCLAGLLGLSADGMVSFFIRTDACGRVFVLIAGLVVAIYYWRLENAPVFAREPRALAADRSRPALPRGAGV